MRFILTGVAAFGVLTAGAAMAQTKSADDDMSQVKCRQFDQTGSNIPKRVCKTKAEWIAYNKAMNSRSAGDTRSQIERGQTNMGYSRPQ